MKILLVMLLVSCASHQEPTAEEKSADAAIRILGQSNELIEKIILQVSKGRKGKPIGIVRSIITRPDRLVAEAIERISVSDDFEDMRSLLTNLHEGLDVVRRQYKKAYLKNMKYLDRHGIEIDGADFGAMLQEKYDTWAQKTLDSFDRALATNENYLNKKELQLAIENGRKLPSNRLFLGILGPDIMVENIKGVHRYVEALRGRITESLDPMDNVQRVPLRVDYAQLK